MFVVAVGLLWSLLDSGGVFDSINKVVADVANDQTDFTVQGSLAFRRVMGVTLVLAVVQVVLITALATLAAFLYNLAAGLVGGLDVTLVEETPESARGRSTALVGPRPSGSMRRTRVGLVLRVVAQQSLGEQHRAYSSDG